MFQRLILIISFLAYFVSAFAQTETIARDNSSVILKQEDMKQAVNQALKDNNDVLLNLILHRTDESVKREVGLKNDLIMQTLDNITANINQEKIKKDKLKKDAKLAFDKAQKLADEGKIKEAGFYYAVACAADPEEGLYVYGYVKSVLNWADKVKKNGVYDTAINSLYEMLNFLYSEALFINPTNAESVMKLINEVEDKIAYFKKEANIKILDMDALSLNEITRQAMDLSSADIPEGLSNLETYYLNCENIIEKFTLLSKTPLSAQAKEALKRLGERMKIVSNLIDTEKYLQKGNDLLLLLMDKKNAHFVPQLIVEAALIGQRLSLIGEGMNPGLQRRILKFGDDFLKISTSINQASSAAEFEKFKIKYDALSARSIKNETNAQAILQNISALQDEMIAYSGKITDAEYLKKLRALLSATTAEAEKWREIQLKRYDVWAIKTVRKFYDTYKNEMGLLGSGSDTKDRIYAGMKDYLCPIEVRYLGAAGLRAYTEVFDFFYKELDRDRRLELSSEFVNCEKRPLSFF